MYMLSAQWHSSLCGGHKYATSCLPRLSLNRTPRRKTPAVTITAVEGKRPEQSNSESTESLFMKELKRRGMADGDLPASGEASKQASARKTSAPASMPEQLKVSRSLSSEGLEGLLPRARELVKLGGTFFLGFGPLLLLFSGLFLGIYLVYGDLFVHGGRSGVRPPPYVDPYEILAEPSAQPFVPFDLQR